MASAAQEDADGSSVRGSSVRVHPGVPPRVSKPGRSTVNTQRPSPRLYGRCWTPTLAPRGGVAWCGSRVGHAWLTPGPREGAGSAAPGARSGGVGLASGAGAWRRCAEAEGEGAVGVLATLAVYRQPPVLPPALGAALCARQQRATRVRLASVTGSRLEAASFAHCHGASFPALTSCSRTLATRSACFPAATPCSASR